MVVSNVCWRMFVGKDPTNCPTSSVAVKRWILPQKSVPNPVPFGLSVGSLAELGFTVVRPEMATLLTLWLRGSEYFRTPLRIKSNSSCMILSQRSEPPSVPLPGRWSRISPVDDDSPRWKNEPSKESGLSNARMLPNLMFGAVSSRGGSS